MSIYGKKQWGQFAPSTLNYHYLPNKSACTVANGEGSEMCLDMISKTRPTIAL